MPTLSRMNRLFGAMVTLALPGIMRAQAAKPVVAVLSFDNNSIGKDAHDYDGLGKGIADLLITDMASNAKLRLVDRERIQMVLQEQNLVQSSSIEPQTAVRVGKILGAQYVVVGGFMKANDSMVLTGRTIDVETTETANPQKVQAKGDDVLALIAMLSGRLNNDITLEAKPGRRVGAAGGAAAPSALGQGSPTQSGVARPGPAKIETFARPLLSRAKVVKLDVATARIYSSALDEM